MKQCHKCDSNLALTFLASAAASGATESRNLFHNDSRAPMELMAAFPESSALNTVGSFQKLAPGYYFNWYSRKIIGF